MSTCSFCKENLSEEDLEVNINHGIKKEKYICFSCWLGGDMTMKELRESDNGNLAID